MAKSAISLAKSPLCLRCVNAVIVTCLLVGFCLWGVAPFVMLIAFFALRARFEFTRACRRRGIRPNSLLSLIGALTPLAVLFSPLSPQWALHEMAIPVLLVLPLGFMAACVSETAAAARASDVGGMRSGQNLAYGLLCGAYVSLFGSVALLRVCPPQEAGGVFPLSGGVCLVALTLVSTMAGDTAAYFVGRTVGRHKLAERLSPGKTVEGLFGGMAASIAVGGMAGYLLLGSFVFGLVVGVAVAVLGPLGDLFASSLKREFRIKDFGAVIPGHGGVLDRFDSLLFTSPVVLLTAKMFGLWGNYFR